MNECVQQEIEASERIEGAIKRMNLSVKVLCSAVILFGFLPFVSVSCFGVNQDANAYQLAFMWTGDDFPAGEALFGLLALLPAVIAVSLLLLSFLGPSRSLNRFTLVAGAVGVVSLILFASMFRSSMSGNGLTGRFEVGYWLTMLSAVGWVIVGSYGNIKTNPEQAKALDGLIVSSRARIAEAIVGDGKTKGVAEKARGYFYEDGPSGKE